MQVFSVLPAPMGGKLRGDIRVIFLRAHKEPAIL